MSEHKFYRVDHPLAFLNFFVRTGFNPTDLSQRPPFPAMIVNPTFGQICKNLNSSDLALYTALTSLTTFFSFFVVKAALRKAPFPKNTGFDHTSDKHALFRVFALTFAAINVPFPLAFSHDRLRGYKNNGLMWKTKFVDHNVYQNMKSQNNSVWNKIF